MSYELDRLDPQNSLVWLPMDGQFSQDVGENLLVDGDMEAAGTGAWIAIDSTLSKETYLGRRCLRIESIAPTFWAYGTNITANRNYTFSGYGAGEAIASPAVLLNSIPVWTGIYSTDWQQFGVAAFTAGTTNRIGSGNAGGVVRFAEVSIREHPRVTRSLSQLPGVLNYARMGDGHTATTSPTQLPGRGLRFDGGDYVGLDFAAGGALDTQTFTVAALVQPSTPAADGRIYEIGIAGQRYSLYYDLSAGQVVWEKDDTVDQTITSGYGSAYGQPFVVVASISNLGMKLWVDDRLMGSVAGDVRLPAFDAASVARFGVDVAGGNFFQGDILGSAIYPFELSSFQVREIGRRMKQMRNV